MTLSEKQGSPWTGFQSQVNTLLCVANVFARCHLHYGRLQDKSGTVLIHTSSVNGTHLECLAFGTGLYSASL